MPVEKILSKIRSQIGEIKPLLDSFSDRAIQPSVSDCEQLQKQLVELQDALSVLKHLKQNYELSPSFNLHARISELASSKEEVRADPEVHHEPVPSPEATPAEKSSADQGEKVPPPRQLKSLHIGLNDKFRFINELFAKNNAEYNIAMEQLSNLRTWPETEIYLASLKNLYDWRDDHDAVKHFFSIVKKRFQ